ncbi:MAG: hypothetical protein RL172_3291 [Bacteroidota bacterium]|jgi:two-component system, NarL family, invasion response regulator UvrY
MTNILLIDDHEIIRSGLKMCVKSLVPDGEVDEAADGDSAYKKVKQKEYQLIVMDICMPGTDSFGLLGNILATRPSANILVFSMNEEKVFAKRYLQLGAKGYICKSAPHSEIINAITVVLNNKRYLSPFLKTLLTDELIEQKKDNPFDNLSQREFEIVQHLIRGESPAAICKKLSIHSSTVATHKARIFDKLNCKNVIEICTLAKANNMITSF